MHPLSQKKHKRECKMSPIENNTEETPKVEKEEKVEAVNPKTAELYRVAQQALEKRKVAPELYVAGVHSDERKELVKRYAPECVDPRFDPRSGQRRRFAEYHACFFPESRASKAAHRGYIPILDENKEHVEHEGDLLFKIPRDMWMEQQVASSYESKMRREATTDYETEKLGRDGGTGTAVESKHTTEILN